MGTNYCVVHLQKFKQNDIRGMEIHLLRLTEHSKNKDIKTEMTKYNYDILDVKHQDGRKLDEKVAEKLSLRAGKEKALRKDAVTLCSVIVSASPEFFKDKTPEQIQNYFESAVDYLNHKFRHCVYAQVHMDEETPHLHYGFVPLTEDNRLCAKEITSRINLTNLQNELPAFLQKRGYDVQRGEVNSPRYHVSTNEWKRDERILNAVKDDLVKRLDFSPTSVLGKKIVSSQHYLDLEQIAKQSVHAIGNNTEISRELHTIQVKQQKLEELSNSLKEQEEKLKNMLIEVEKENAQLMADKKSFQDYKTRCEAILKAQDKNIELAKLISDNRSQQQLLQEKREALGKEEERIRTAHRTAYNRLMSAVISDFKKKLDSEPLDYWEKKALGIIRKENPQLYEQCISKAKREALEKGQNVAKEHLRPPKSR